MHVEVRLTMKGKETMGTSGRMTVKGTTDGDRHQDMVKVTTEIWERGGRPASVRGRGVRDRVVTTCAVTVYSSV